AGYAIAACCAMAAVCNLVVIHCAIKLVKRSDETLHIYITVMACGDLLLTGFAYPADILNRPIGLKSVTFCSIVQCSVWFGFAVSGFFLALVNADKYALFHWPLRYRTFTQTRALLLSSVLLGITLALVCALWVFRVIYMNGTCTLIISRQKIYAYDILVISLCIVSLISSLLVSVYLLVLICRRKLNFPGATGRRLTRLTVFLDK
ncbi:Protein AEXR-1, partial [Aphelenchoides avenae]